MSLEGAFLADIIAHPADDAPRLVYADWLEEHGDEKDQDRAAFIRAGCQVAGLPPESPERIGAEVRVTSGKDLDEGYPLVAAVGRAASPDRAPRLIEL